MVYLLIVNVVNDRFCTTSFTVQKNYWIFPYCLNESNKKEFAPLILAHPVNKDNNHVFYWFEMQLVEN